MTLRAEGFVEAPSEATRRLLEPPAFEVTLRSGEPGAEPIAALQVGRPDAANRRPVRVGSGGCSRSRPIESATSRAR